MFGWFKKQEDVLTEFPDNQAAFAYACEKQQHRILLEAMIPALVEEEGRRGSEGERCFRVTLALASGRREMWTCVLPGSPDVPEIGALVGFRVVSVADDFAPHGDPIGYIACVLAPVLSSRKGWKIAQNLTPANLKPTVRF